MKVAEGRCARSLTVASRAPVIPMLCGMHDRSTLGYRALGSLRSGGPAVGELNEGNAGTGCTSQTRSKNRFQRPCPGQMPT